MRRTKEEANITKGKIFDAALEMFSRMGYDATTIEAIANLAGVTRGAVNWHFKSKASLYIELIDNAGKKSDTVLINATQTGGSFKEICKRLLVSYWILIEEDKVFRDTLKLTLKDINGIAELSVCHEMQKKATKNLIENVTRYMEMGILSGEIKNQQSAKIMAYSFLGYQKGIIVNWLSAPEIYSLKEVSEALADLYINNL